MGYPHPTVEVPGVHPHIADEIRNIRFADANSESLLAGLLDANANCAQGHVCATAWVLNSDHTMTLLVKHKTLGWSTPGGHLQLSETTAVAAMRELREETGLQLHPSESHPAIVHPSISTSPSVHTHWNVGWLFHVDINQPLTAEDGAKLRFFNCDELPTGASDLVSIIALLRKI